MIDIADIKASIQSRTLIQDEFFKNADFLKDSRGRLISYTGGYSVVIPCNVNGEKWAFRCWHIPVKDSKDRYSYISRAIKNSNLPFFCSFDYEGNGLLVNGNVLPITKMKWIEGMNLKKYICTHCQEREKIIELAKSFLDMVINLHSYKIAHGDLQHGNIIVSTTGELYLVDYDSMYVPQMGESFPDIITGLIDYQHPRRCKNLYSSEKLDYFSELIIYISLLGIAECPEFVYKYNIENSESLLFTAKDFEDLVTSRIFRELKDLNNSRIDKCLLILQEYLSYEDLNCLKPIEDYLISIEIDYPKIVPINEVFSIKWTTKGVQNIQISDFGKVDINGKIDLSLAESKDIKFTLYAESSFRREKIIRIETRKRAVVNHFKVDKNFTLENVPIRLDWDCSDADEVEIIGFGKQNSVGNLITTIERETTFVLQVKDAFGEQRQSQSIHMIPLPVIKELWIPIPKIEKEVAIRYNAPNFKMNMSPLSTIIELRSPMPKIEKGMRGYFVRPNFNAKIPLSEINIPLRTIEDVAISLERKSLNFNANLTFKRKCGLSLKSLVTYFFRK